MVSLLYTSSLREMLCTAYKRQVYFEIRLYFLEIHSLTVYAYSYEGIFSHLKIPVLGMTGLQNFAALSASCQYTNYTNNDKKHPKF